MNTSKINMPESRDLVFKSLFYSCSNSENQKRKASTIFQIVYYNINNSPMKTPLPVSIGETIHQINRSKLLIQILNRIKFQTNHFEQSKEIQ